MKILLVITLLTTLSLGLATIVLNDERRLGKSLIDNYERVGKFGRPVAKVSDAWNVTLGLALRRITEVDFESQSIEVIIWQFMDWKDVGLTWAKTDFNVDSINLSPADITMPDITAYNAASSAEPLANQPLVVVGSDGSIIYIPPFKQKFSCPMDEDDDTITCTLKYGSWTYNGYQLNLAARDREIDVAYYESNPNWKLVSTNVSRRVKVYDCCPEPYIDISFNVTLKKT